MGFGLLRRKDHLVGLVKLAVRNQLRKDGGYSFSERKDLVDDIDDLTIANAALKASVEVPYLDDDAVAVTGDHPIIDAIIEFLKSPQGQALIAALIQLLIGFIKS